MTVGCRWTSMAAAATLKYCDIDSRYKCKNLVASGEREPFVKSKFKFGTASDAY